MIILGMMVNPKAIFNLLKASVSAWSDDKSPRMGAALSYYTIFAMPPLFMIAIFIASLFFDSSSVQKANVFRSGRADRKE